MPPAAPEQAKRGPFTVLLLLFGLVLGSAFAAAARADLSEAPARLAQHRPGKPGALLRTGARELASDSEDRRDEPFTDSQPPRLAPPIVIVQPGTAASPATPRTSGRAAPSSYDARAPPAA